ncbi:2-oxo-4-hydroxy-4-carboxy-5-ureidoimidazoline decarboxylase [Antrihabitans sp. YC2-6]|uniref:2-oxo-4-hydroxy-4-carboxy-5-ureidoimidazoline decarboxylase n=1 Tax=Antrihabitans sp. YC2-6 TaxID=2799498 RepID=UPI0018F66C08|nr:2-oxo-4-hydroxy-4-carboxy-5-ureidoimidazoline decarboxylase [Antrihabitans sp. YC2-6]MBJ8343423.1 2-oxo-4-hydroxy-4-carboxy-5-ureidoimidazoline decarboxylase [Antrihabitans sp. YC2-6]
MNANRDIGLERFNVADAGASAHSLVTCLDVPRWVNDILAARPYADRGALMKQVDSASSPLRPDEIARALQRHPRIGDRISGGDADARMSRSEQSGVDATDPAVKDRLTEGNHAYEAKFGQVFLISATGLHAEEILARLDERLTNDPAAEQRIIERELRSIAKLRLAQLLDA